MSDFTCPVIRVGTVTRHPNADSLSITEVDGQPVVFRTEDLASGDLAVYVPLEAIVHKDTEGGRLMSWLPFKNGEARIRAAKLRGVFSMGVLLKAPELVLSADSLVLEPTPAEEGDEVSAWLGITKYEEPEPTATGVVRGPDGLVMSMYDLKAFRKYQRMYRPDEYVAITEKVHGANARFAHWGGQMCVGSHRCWWDRPGAEGKTNFWWEVATAPIALANGKTLEEQLQHPDVKDKLGFYGEVYGRSISDLRYGMGANVGVAMFDIIDLKTQKFLDYPDFLAVCAGLKLETTPCLYTGQFKDADVFALAEGPTEIGPEGQPAPHMREGVVVRQLLEHPDEHIGRLCLKLHGQGFLLRKGDRKEGH